MTSQEASAALTEELGTRDNTARWRERPVWITGQGHPMLGVFTAPTGSARARSAALIVVGGPQYRAGSHRQFVHMARALALGGVATLRFDACGMGDSAGDTSKFTELTADIDAACQALMSQVPGVQEVSLIGLCDGASAILMYLRDRPDARVAGIVLLNPWVRHEATLATTQVRHYYLRRFFQKALWRQVLGGGLSTRAVRDFLSSLRLAWGARVTKPSGRAGTADFRDQMRQGLSAFEGRTLVMLSGNDFVAKEFRELCRTDGRWAPLLQRPRSRVMEMADADHTISRDSDEDLLHAQLLSFVADQADSAE